LARGFLVPALFSRSYPRGSGGAVLIFLFRSPLSSAPFFFCKSKGSLLVARILLNRPYLLVFRYARLLPDSFSFSFPELIQGLIAFLFSPLLDQ